MGIKTNRKPQTHSRSNPRDIHFWDWIFAGILRTTSLGFVAVLVVLGLFLLQGALPALQHFGLDFLTASVWDPVRDQYGAAPVVFGTLVSSFMAVFLSAPLSVGAALFLEELAPPRLARILGFWVEMLAAIPSVVYGLWGLFVLVPWLRKSVEPWLSKTLGFLPLFQGPPFGVGMLAAGIILAIMITPTIFALSREVIRAVPQGQREAAIGLGATRWETLKIAVLQSARSGIQGAIILGLGRALGETMAVTLVIGNQAQISASLFAPAQTMASVIANEYAEATSDLHLSALAAIGFLLFAITFLVNSLARLILFRNPHRRGVRS